MLGSGESGALPAGASHGPGCFAPGLVATRGDPAGLVRTPPALGAVGEGHRDTRWQWETLASWRPPCPAEPLRSSASKTLLGGGRSPLLSVLQTPIGGFPVSAIGAVCWPGAGDSEGRSEMLSGVLQPRSWVGVTQGGCCRDGFGFLQQTRCFNEEE